MKKKNDPSFSQWLVMLSIPLCVLAVGALFRMLIDHETRMAQIEAKCGGTAIVQTDRVQSDRTPSLYAVPPSASILAYPQAPFVGLIYRFGNWLFHGQGPAKIQEKKQ